MMGEGDVIPSNVFGLRVCLLPLSSRVGGLTSQVGPLVGTAAVFGVQEWLWSSAGGRSKSFDS